jgi:glycosyltransferase involved in cell wall biosynthesis
MNKDIAIVIPCFNEASRFPFSYWSAIICDNPRVYWIFVDDGSTDKTTEILQDLSRDLPVEFYKSDRNLGKGNAIRFGLLNALGLSVDIKFFGYLDSDGAFNQTDIRRLIDIALTDNEVKYKNSSDAIISSRVALAGRSVVRKKSRHYIGRVIATILTANWKEAPYDTQSGFKLFKNSDSFREAVKTPFLTKWFMDIELLVRIGVLNQGALQIWEEPVSAWRDISGSKINLREFPILIREIAYARQQVLALLEKRNQSGSHRIRRN